MQMNEFDYQNLDALFGDDYKDRAQKYPPPIT
jgi:hypothetical protein